MNDPTESVVLVRDVVIGQVVTLHGTTIRAARVRGILTPVPGVRHLYLEDSVTGARFRAHVALPLDRELMVRRVEGR